MATRTQARESVIGLLYAFDMGNTDAHKGADEYVRYVTQVKSEKIEHASLKNELEIQEYNNTLSQRGIKAPLTTKNQARKAITAQKFKQLQEKLKL